MFRHPSSMHTAPAKTVTSPGTAQVAVVPDPDAPVAPVEPEPPDAASSGELPDRGVAIRRFVHVNPAGPPVMVTVASPGRFRRRYCCAGSSVPDTENVGGATLPAVAPTDSSWPAMTDRALSVPAAGAVTSSYRKIAGFGLPSASTLSAGSRSIGTLTLKMMSPSATDEPWVTKILLTVPAAVDLSGTAGSADTVALITTSFVIVPAVAITRGSTTVPVGCAGSASAGRSGKNASLISAAAMTATRRMRRMGKTHVRAIAMKPPGTVIVVVEPRPA